MTFLDEVKGLRDEAIWYMSNDPSGIESWREACAKLLVAEWIERRRDDNSASQNTVSVFCVYASWRTSRNDFIREQMLAERMGERRYSDETIRYMTQVFEARVTVARNDYLAEGAMVLYKERMARIADAEEMSKKS